MGVSHFSAENFIQKYGKEGENISFISNRARMEEIWQYYAKKWADYGKQVVWQFGLRGKADQAVWKADPSVPNSMEKRGQIITDAIQTQYDIVRTLLGTDDFHSTATLWNEGSELFGKTNYIYLPKFLRNLQAFMQRMVLPCSYILELREVQALGFAR